MEIMKKVGCRPPYWDLQAGIPNCTSHDQLLRLGRKIHCGTGCPSKIFGIMFQQINQNIKIKKNLIKCERATGA
jgi:hypothetical protein